MYPANEPAPDEVIHVSTTGYLLPSPVQELISEKQWSHTTASHCYHQGCYGAFPAVHMAAGSLTAAACGLTRQATRVDIAHTEICSIHTSPECIDPEHIISNSLFGDGFIRYSASTAEAFHAHHGRGLEVVRLADATIPGSLEAMTWQPIANRFEMTLSIRVPLLIANHVEPFISGMLRDTGLDSPSESSRMIWVIHPGGPAIIELVRDRLGLTDDQIRHSKDVLRDGGNTSSATVPRIWDRILRDAELEPGTPVISMAFGPGLTSTAMIARIV
jgi:alkylresorcinol/alkylpyrone synthase